MLSARNSRASGVPSHALEHTALVLLVVAFFLFGLMSLMDTALTQEKIIFQLTTAPKHPQRLLHQQNEGVEVAPGGGSESVDVSSPNILEVAGNSIELPLSEADSPAAIATDATTTSQQTSTPTTSTSPTPTSAEQPTTPTAIEAPTAVRAPPPPLTFDPPAKLIPVPQTPAAAPIRFGQPDNYDEFAELFPSTATEVMLPGTVGSIRSPSGNAELTVFLTKEGMTAYRVVNPRTNQIIFDNALLDLKLEFKMCLFRAIASPPKTEVRIQVSQGKSYWKPVKGFERNEYSERFTSLQTWCEGQYCQQCVWKTEWRVFDHGLSVRALLKPDLTREETASGKPNYQLPEEWVHVHYGLHIALPQRAGLTCWANNLEEPYVTKPCAIVVKEMMVPMSVSVAHDPAGDDGSHSHADPQANAYVFTQTAGFGFTQAVIKTQSELSNSRTVTLSMIAKGEAQRRPSENLAGMGDVELDTHLGPVTSTSWQVMLWGKSNVETVEQSSIIRVLAPPTPPVLQPMFQDIADWVRPGKLLRIRAFDTGSAKTLTDFAVAHGYDYIHFDAGWYGDENDKRSKATQVHPSIQHMLDFKAVSEYAHSRTPRIGLSIYVNDLALRDTLELKGIYKNWGVDGIKFGFVNLNRPSNVRTVHQRVLSFAESKLFVNIHDYYRPRSFSRTFPNLLTQEGIRGEERKPDCTHHTILPFVRFVAGSADYTPRMVSMKPKCTRAHQLALPIILFSPIQSLFWAEEFQTIQQLSAGSKEISYWQQLSSTWDDSRILHGEIGQFVVYARRKDATWFVATVNNDEGERKVEINLLPLFVDGAASTTTDAASTSGVSVDATTLSTVVAGFTVAPTLISSPHPALPKLAEEGYVIEIWADSNWAGVELREMNSVQVRPVQYLYLPSAVVQAVLSNSAAPTATVPQRLTEWAQSRAQGVFVLKGLIIPAFLAPSGGHCMRIMPVNDFLLQAK